MMRCNHTAGTLLQICLVQMSNIDETVICRMPWASAFIDPERNTVPCCHIRNQRNTIFSQSISEQINSPLFIKVRQEMIAGIRPTECHRCYDAEGYGGYSARLRYSDFGIDAVDFSMRSDGTIDNAIQFLEVRCSNVCQNKCRHCGSESSSSIALEEVKFFGSTKPVRRFPGNTDQWIVDAVVSCANTLKQIRFSGGEPMVQWQHYEILKQLIALGKTDIQLLYNSNSGCLSLGRDNVLDLWKHFTKVTYFTSVDADDPVMSYWRPPTTLEGVLLTIDKIRREASNVTLWNNTALSWPTLSSALSAVKSLREVGIQTGFTMVTNPTCFSLRNLPDFKKRQFEPFILSQPDYIPKDMIIQFMNQEPAADIRDGFAHQLKLDKIRGEDFFKVFPDHEDMRPYLT